MSGISRKIVSGARTAKMSVRDEGGGGGARGRPNKYLTKSSGKLIPSFGRLLRGAPSTAARRRRARADPAFHFAIFLVRFRERIGRNHDPAKLGDERRKHWNVRITRARDSLSVFHSSRGINVPRSRFRLTPHMFTFHRR